MGNRCAVIRGCWVNFTEKVSDFYDDHRTGCLVALALVILGALALTGYYTNKAYNWTQYKLAVGLTAGGLGLLLAAALTYTCCKRPPQKKIHGTEGTEGTEQEVNTQYTLLKGDFG